jgi:menaquinone-dependent protoporphyrinogen IX oxidase
MRIEYYHASKYGNGAKVAEEFKKIMTAKGVEVNVHHVRDAKPYQIPPADLYVFSSPGRMGKPIKSMRKLLTKLQLPSGSRYAILATEMNPQPDKKTGKVPTEEELGRCQRVIPIINDILKGKGLIRTIESKVYVIGIRGPLENQWQEKVGEFAAAILNGG